MELLDSPPLQSSHLLNGTSIHLRGKSLFLSVLRPSYLIYQQVFSTHLPKHILNASLPAFTPVPTSSKPLSSPTDKSGPLDHYKNLITSLLASTGIPPSAFSQGSQGDHPAKTTSNHPLLCLKTFLIRPGIQLSYSSPHP